jgi:hypothetical protein
MCTIIKENAVKACTCKLAHVCKRRQIEMAKENLPASLNNPNFNCSMTSLLSKLAVINAISHGQKGGM